MSTAIISRYYSRAVRLNIFIYIITIALTCFFIFLSFDSITTYYMMLFNNSEYRARRSEDFHVVDQTFAVNTNAWGSGTAGAHSSSGTAGTGSSMVPNGNVSNAMSNFTEKELQEPETIARFVIYEMDQAGYTKNAVIGTISYILAEGGGFGFYTYESYWLSDNPGPSGVAKDTTLNNQAWRDWMPKAAFGFYHDSYQEQGLHSHNNPRGGKLSAIGLGLMADSDVFYYRMENGKEVFDHYDAANATALLDFADSKGGPWQDPGIQMEWIIQKKLIDKTAWDLDIHPGVDPKSSIEVSATEWAVRVLCGIGMPAWDSKTCKANHAKSYKDHTANIDAATEWYEQYHGKDPIFYSNPPASSVLGNFVQSNEGTATLGGITFHSPQKIPNISGNSYNPYSFSLPSYPNSTPQGLLLARVATMFAGCDISQGTGDALLDFTERDKRGPDSVTLNSTPLLYYYKTALLTIGEKIWFASCDRSVAAVVRCSGFDDDFVLGGTSDQIKYMKAHPEKWKYIKTWESPAELQVGDILIYEGHVKMWVGYDIPKERYPKSTACMYQGSQDDYFPRLDDNSKPHYGGKTYEIWRCVNTVQSTKYLDAWNGILNEVVE